MKEVLYKKLQNFMMVVNSFNVKTNRIEIDFDIVLQYLGIEKGYKYMKGISTATGHIEIIIIMLRIKN